MPRKPLPSGATPASPARAFRRHSPSADEPSPSAKRAVGGLSLERFAHRRSVRLQADLVSPAKAGHYKLHGGEKPLALRNPEDRSGDVDAR
jgi:hypothetical protein